MRWSQELRSCWGSTAISDEVVPFNFIVLSKDDRICIILPDYLMLTLDLKNNRLAMVRPVSERGASAHPVLRGSGIRRQGWCLSGQAVPAALPSAAGVGGR
jgi:hypothetical protein